MIKDWIIKKEEIIFNFRKFYTNTPNQRIIPIQIHVYTYKNTEYCRIQYLLGLSRHD